MCSKYFQIFCILIIISSLIFFGCTSDESYDNSGFVSEVNTALPDTNTIPFVVVGSSGSIYTSLDGISWTNKTIENETNDLRTVTYGDGIFVALAGHDTIYYSTDTNNWTKTSSPIIPSATNCFAYHRCPVSKASISGLTPASVIIEPIACNIPGVLVIT